MTSMTIALLFVLVLAAIFIYRQQNALRQYKSVLAKSEAEWTQAMEFLEDPMYLVDLDDRLVRANRAFLKQIGKTPEEALGRDVRSLIHLKPEEKPCPACAARLERRDAFFTKEANDPTNPTGRPIEVTIRVIRDGNGKPIGMLQGLRDLSHLRQTEEELRKSRAKLANAQRIAHIGNWEWNVELGEMQWSDELYRIYGLKPGERAVNFKTAMEYVHAEDREFVTRSIKNILRDKNALNIDYRIVLADATVRHVQLQAEPETDAVGKLIFVSGTLQDITERQKAAEALFEEKERAQVTLQAIGDAVITTDVSGNIEYINPVAEQLIGQTLSSVKAAHYFNVLKLVNETDGKAIEDPIKRCFNDDKDVVRNEHCLLIGVNKREFAVDITVASIRDRKNDVIGAVLVMHDVTEMHGLTRQLNFQATHDALTGLINRREFEIRLQQALDSARIDKLQHALIFMDLDQFKIVNDTCGHIAGDELLKQVADLFANKVRNVDTLARLGGDEFAVLLEACPVQKAKQIAETLRKAVEDYRFVWEGKLFEIGVSIGLVPINPDSGTRTDILSHADAACYVAKDLGRNRIHVYKPDDAALAQHQGEMQWVHKINHAVKEDRFVLYCQAIKPLNAASNKAQHYEILVRMLDQQNKIIAPYAFIPSAERYHLMPSIDRWVFKNSLEHIRSIGTAINNHVFAINLSGQTICDDSFLGFVLEEFEKTGVPPTCICFEVTETAAVANLSKASRFIAILKGVGVQFALDDFGSGLSSFAYLKNLAVDYLKIDGSFIKDMIDDPIDCAMVSSINEIGHLMGLHTIAEFVESKAISNKLGELTVDFAQGYYFDEPKPLHQVLKHNTAEKHIVYQSETA
jgi:diguanylate cyclase (GGDEF)-like protein/PAS domain S-box-containing protein